MAKAGAGEGMARLGKCVSRLEWLLGKGVGRLGKCVSRLEWLLGKRVARLEGVGVVTGKKP